MMIVIVILCQETRVIIYSVQYFSQKVAEVEKSNVDSSPSQTDDTAEVEDDWLDQSR